MDNKEQGKKIGRQVAHFRNLRKLTQTDLGGRIGVSQSVLASYETGRRALPVSLVACISQALDVSVDELLGLPVNHTKPGPKSQLEKQLRRISQLPRSEQQYVSKFLDQVLTVHSQ